MISQPISTKVIISTHIYATGPALDLRDYLNIQKVSQLLFISHPLFFSTSLRGSGFQVFNLGQLVSETYHPHKKIPDLLTYLIHPFFTLWFVLRSHSHWQLFVGSDNLNAICGLILKLLGVVDKTVYYVIDYNPRRFQNRLLNSIYHLLDRICVRYCDETWNLSPRMAPAREKYFGFTGGQQKVVYLGIWYDRIRARTNIGDFDPHTLVYMGQVAKKQGIQHVLAAIPAIVKKIPQFKFLVLGGGDYLADLKHQVTQLNLDTYVEFTGFIADHKVIEKRLSHCALSVALYDKYVDGSLSFTYFTDPGKIKVYLAAGLPVLVSDVPYNASVIQNKNCGLVVSNSPQSISQAVLQLMMNPEKLLVYRKNAVALAASFDWNLIFPRALKNLL